MVETRRENGGARRNNKAFAIWLRVIVSTVLSALMAYPEWDDGVSPDRPKLVPTKAMVAFNRTDPLKEAYERWKESFGLLKSRS